MQDPTASRQLLRRSIWSLALCWMLSLTFSGTLLAGTSASAPRQPRIIESDVTPQSPPMTFSHLLDEYLAMVQERLKQQTALLQASGLIEVKLTIRQDGSVTFSEIVVLDGPAALRHELLPLVNQLGPLPPPPMDADMLDVSVLLSLRYPSPDLLDAIDQAN
jgi:hypothetical protein